MIGIQLERPLVIFDLEATGLKVSQARIIQIGMIKIHPSGAVENFEAMVNPMTSIPTEIEELTGIRIDDVRDKPPFAQIATEVARFIEDCDLAGFNIRRFDLPLLSQEMYRSGIVNCPKDDVRVVDAQVIFHTEEPRTLEAAYRFYCKKVHTQSHNAMGDTMATLQVLDKQINQYQELPRNVEGLHQYCLRGKAIADFAGLLYINEDNELAWNFGKHKDQPVFSQINYAHWFLREDFPFQSQKVLAEYLGEDWYVHQHLSPIEF